MDNEVVLKDVIKDSFTQYAGAVIQSRALTDVRDCIKPSARQIYYSMFTDNFIHEKPFNKTLKSIGSSMRFYIHGDASCEGIIMRSGQPFSMRYPLVEVEGSYGNLMETGNWAAPRYTASRLSELSNYLLSETNIHTIDEWIDNYDDTEQYPRVLSSLGYYNIVNGSTGIAVGLASSIPQFNLKEVNNALITLLNSPDCDFNDIVCYPDFATGGTLINKDEVFKSLEKGNGKACVLQAKIEKDEKNSILIVRELPYSVYTNTICGEIEKLTNEYPDIGIININDLTGENVCIKIYCDKKTNLNDLISFLYSNTSLQKSYSINMTMLENGRFPKVFGWREALLAHLEHEKEVYLKVYEHELKQLKHKLKILDGILLAISDIDRTINIIKKADSSKDAVDKLQTAYDLDEEQSKAVLDMRLSRLSKLENDKLQEDKTLLESRINSIKSIINSEQLLKQKMIEKFQEVSEKFGDERRTKITQKEIAKVKKEKVEKEEVVENVAITFNSDGYIQSVPISEFKKTSTKYVNSFKTDTSKMLLFFTNLGNVYRVRVSSVKKCGLKDKGMAASTLIKLQPSERVLNILSMENDSDKPYVVFFTKKGMLKKAEKSVYVGNTQNLNGTKACGLTDDVILGIYPSNGDIAIIGTDNGMVIKFKLEDVSPQGKTSKGVKAINLQKNDEVTSVIVIRKEDSVLINGKRCELKEQKRGGKGVKKFDSIDRIEVI